ncbi:MAG: 30S ribosomal protein S17 [Candidatus Thorarchaeota archaeon]|nr:MAG: 30S ribosomal protein S17 [Candidatus Thorarchaeota archaeon]
MAKDKQKVRNIGIAGVNPPEKICDDPNCPFHGNLPVRGRLMEGIVTSTKMHKAITYQTDYIALVKKFMRYERRRTKKHAYLPSCIDVKAGDYVRVAECRPISKTISSVVIHVTPAEIKEE